MDPVKIETFSLARSGDVNVCAAVSNEKQLKEVYNFSVAAAEVQKPISVRTVETTTLNDVLEHTPYAGQEIDLLSIDVEGHDYEVLRSIDISRYKPKIIIVESTLTSIREVIASAIFRYLEERNYRLVSWTYLSLIFRVERSQIFRTQL
ncbi:FkbM family methyltransferase [Paraburkholderia tuberum]|uniref:FkbM family methyltransferase n=1 Tax=Paraburkholderia tuberum TaxID=157910 RepID=UPI000B1EC4EE|nr:FkbM family methyltransferase [Paraburkholderia tuberum]